MGAVVTTVGEHLQSTNEAICQNIASLSDKRALLSQNVLAQLRSLIEGVAVRLHLGTSDAEYTYAEIDPGLAYVRGKANLNFLGKFHKMLQKSSSHYTMNGDTSERLMLKYYEYLLRVRTLLEGTCEIALLANLESFPVDLDQSLQEYHQKIAERIETAHSAPPTTERRDRYYIHKTSPFFVGGRIFYEVTFYPAMNNVSKFDRVIAFTDIDMTDKYSAYLVLERDMIHVLDQTMPITIIREWEVSIRPCEFNNLARLFGINIRTRAGTPEFHYLMKRLTESSGSLLDFIDMPDSIYEAEKSAGTAGGAKPLIFPVLDEARRIIRASAPGSNTLRYLMLAMHNQILKPQYSRDECWKLSNLKLQWGCIPFDTMPFCTSLRNHNPRYWDLVESLDPTGREHELLARRVRNNVERYGILYTPVVDLTESGDVTKLISRYNDKVYSGHPGRKLLEDKDHVFIREYEDQTVDIVERLQRLGESGIAGYSVAVERWLDETAYVIDDDEKKAALTLLFSESNVALIYGAAGTGKSTMVNHIANYFNDKTKLFLAHTNPAKDNLERRVNSQNSTFRTIHNQNNRTATDLEYDVLIIDECSTVSNSDLLAVLEKTNFELLVLVGDVYQIESIQFGNWFSIIPSFLPSTSVFELTTPYRTKSMALRDFWDKVRNIDDDITEVIARNGYATVLDKSLFEAQADDEIILCLNYDGLYGINNVNRFMQNSNQNPAIHWGASTFKVDDPVLFNETRRFWPVIYNNLKGKIVAIEVGAGEIQFDVELDRPLSAFDVSGSELQWVGESTVRFSVFDLDTSDEDDDSLQATVPFQVAYAVSIHKAQGLEYDSVKIVITDANEEDITHSIFYTAVTRTRERLKIFWTPETQQKVLNSLHRSQSPKDVALLSVRRGFVPRPYPPS